MALPMRPPFALRARVLTPRDAGDTLHLADGLVAVDAAGRLSSVGTWQDDAPEAAAAIDLRPLVVLPGMVDLHAHLPQLPNAGLGAGLDLLTWLERYIFPLERKFDDAEAAARLAPAAFRAFAAAGTTTLLAYGAVFVASMDGAFRAAEAHGIRAILGKVMMDRITYDEQIDPATILERSLRESAELCERWHGADDGRLGYAVTPRFAVSCTAEMLRESAALAARTGAWWQTHVAEDPFEIAEVRGCFPRRSTTSTCTTARAASGSRRPRPRGPALGPGARPAGRDRHPRRPLPGLEPVPRLGDHAARPASRAWPEGRARLGRRGRSGSVDLLGHAGGRLRAGRPARPRR